MGASGRDGRFRTDTKTKIPSRNVRPAGPLRTDELAKRNVTLRVTDARATVRDLLRAEGVDEKVGGVNRFASVADVVDDFLAESSGVGHPADPQGHSSTQEEP